MGNQGAYDLWGNLNMAVAGLCIPVSQAVNGVAGASNSVIAKTAAIKVGKEIVADQALDFVSSNITDFTSQKLNLNKTQSTLLNLGLSFGLDKGADLAKSKISGAASFAEGMNYDDAKRYNDYWNKVELGNNTRYPGLTDTDIKVWDFADTKLNENIALKKMDSNEFVKLRMEQLELENSLSVVDEGVSNPDYYKYSEFGEMSYQDGKKYSAWNKLREDGLTYEQVEKIKVISKGKKPLTDSYLSDEYISKHLNSFKESGAVKIMPNEPYGTIGGKGGTFVMSRSELNDIIRNANGDVSKIETLLGLDPGYLGENPVIVTIKDTSSIRIPSGNELGAWPEYWEPGGYTSGGIKEAVVDPVKEGGYIYEHLFK